MICADATIAFENPCVRTTLKLKPKLKLKLKLKPKLKPKLKTDWLSRKILRTSIPMANSRYTTDISHTTRKAQWLVVPTIQWLILEVSSVTMVEQPRQSERCC